MRNHKIIYAPGSGGNFLREVLSAYIVDRSVIKLNNLGVPIHNINAPVYTQHTFEPSPDLSTCLIGVNYNNSDAESIAILNYQKFVKYMINNPVTQQKYIDKYNNSDYIVAVANATDNQQSIFVEGCIEGLHNDVWGIRKNLDQFDLVITFQTLLNDAKLLSNTIATFLNKPVNDKLTQSVEHWQSISNSLINGTR